jgi:predicted nucleic acid-binding protein
MWVVDANVAMSACGADDGFARFRGDDLIAPPLMWSEFLSGFHRAVFVGAALLEEAELALARLDHAPIRERRHRKLRGEAWRIADELGWSKTYDAEYLALARLTGSRVVTFDRRLWQGGRRLGLALSPEEAFGP